ncbi:hypothetical protein [Labrys wisconsinensis]|uniref:dTDP-4-amino-4,6-dideoxygalactose transaminase n=1 Tax=Labrys wisconsinensis TaxID=425677 RepID=A0ABU0J2B9_9HYPH|nr:hypothetical protein [Labrys wisconsinensis]MDQ0468397.1 dTDP-4-amino-4,6-dideoxygalactose transaminase [Labrys wisconsinensis]
MRPRRSVLAVGGGLFVLAAASLLDMAKVPTPVAAARGDRLDVAEAASRCSLGSLMAACATAPMDDVERAKARTGALIQVFEKPGETILVRVRLGD